MGFRLVRRDGGEHAAHAKRLAAKLRAQPVVAACSGIAFVEDQVDDFEHGGETLRELVAAGSLVGQAGLRQGALGAHDALGDGRLGQQEGAGDLAGREAADHPERQRRAGFARQAWMTGSEDQPQHLVADIVVEGGLPVGHRLLLMLQVQADQLMLAFEHPAAA
jgi:hypothetical protein